MAAQNLLERRVTFLVGKALPEPSDSGRNEWGVLWFKWVSPCAEVKSLCLSVSGREVVLSCDVTHTHIGASNIHQERLTNRGLKQRIAVDAVREAQRFFRGQIAVACEVTADGSMGASSWCPIAKLPSLLEDVKRISDRDWRAWTWIGEAKV